jgi:dienelactone hydrolase
MHTTVGDLVVIPIEPRQQLEADLMLPERATGLVVFAHGSGSSRFSSRNRAVAESLQHYQLGTLLFDLLTKEEESVDMYTNQYRFDIDRLGRRLVQAIDWLRSREDLLWLPLGCFGASTGAAAALIAAAQRPRAVRAVVCRGGRPDLADAALAKVKAPTLLIVGGRDELVIDVNEEAYAKMRAAHVELAVVPDATHLFEEPGALEEVQSLAGEWFARYLMVPAA